MDLKKAFFIVYSVLSSMTLCAQKKSFTVDSDFPGGNIVVDAIKGDSVFIHQSLFETEGNWFYWDFRVKGAAGRTLVFTFTHPWGKDVPALNVIGLRGAAISVDAGTTWAWKGTAGVVGTSFKHTFLRSENNVMFSYGMPYTEANFKKFIRPYENNIYVNVGSLAMTKGGRIAEKIHLGNIHGKPKYKLVLTARHHASEMMADYILEGLIKFVLEDEGEGKWLRENTEMLIIPFVDKDGVEDGDQGKQRVGRDHNRDYSGESLYATTAALRSFLPVWSKGKLVAALDLHCPYIRGAVHEVVQQIAAPVDSVWQEQRKFSAYLQSATENSPIPYFSKNDLKYGVSWNVPTNFTAGANFTAWASTLPEVRLATIIEFPYAVASGHTVDQQNSRVFGKDLAHALFNYLQAIQ